MLTRGAGETFTLGIPIRRIKEWCKKEGLEWAIDPSKTLPSQEELENMPLEDRGKNSGSNNTKELKDFPVLIKQIKYSRPKKSKPLKAEINLVRGQRNSS